MNFLGGGEHHRSDANPTAQVAAHGRHTASPGDLLSLGRPGDVRNFIHRSFIGRAVGGAISTVVGSVPLVGGVASGLFDRLRGEGAAVVPQATQCPPGFFLSPTGCVPIARVQRDRLITTQSVPGVLGGGFLGRQGTVPQPTPAIAGLRSSMGLEIDPAAGVPVMGRFGAGFEPSVIMTDTRRCGRGAVLGVDGICYNKRDLRNNERFWPRGRRPLLTGGEMRAISTASSAAKKLQRKQKQLEGLGLLKRPAPRTRRALPAGHRAELTHG